MDNIDVLMKKLDLEAKLVEIRRDFHKHPELSEKEFETGNKICKLLDEWKIGYKRGFAETGIVAVIEGGGIGKTVALRGDIDALPIEEKNTEAVYCSQNMGVMHACGHDAHITILRGTARVLNEMKLELSGCVKLIFQPAEETIGGATRMISEGCLENPHVDYVLGLHVEPSYEVGSVGIKYGKMYASSDMLDLKVMGKSSHGAHPEEGVDTIIVVANILNTLQTVISRSIGANTAAVCSFGTITGGQVRNQIADCVELKGILRTLDPQTRIATQEKIRKICEGVADSMGARAELIVHESYGALINNNQVTEVVYKNARRLLGDENVVIEEEPDLGTEDFSYFAKEREACYFHLGCRGHMDTEFVGLHNSRFDIDEGCLALGVKLQVENVLTLQRALIK